MSTLPTSRYAKAPQVIIVEQSMPEAPLPEIVLPYTRHFLQMMPWYAWPLTVESVSVTREPYTP